MKRIVMLLTVGALMMAMVAMSAAPAFAKQNCSFDESSGVYSCRGGEGYGGFHEAVGAFGSGFGGQYSVDTNTGDEVLIGGGGIGGNPESYDVGGYSRHCEGNFFGEDPYECVGGGSENVTGE